MTLIDLSKVHRYGEGCHRSVENKRKSFFVRHPHSHAVMATVVDPKEKCLLSEQGLPSKVEIHLWAGVSGKQGISS